MPSQESAATQPQEGSGAPTSRGADGIGEAPTIVPPHEAETVNPPTAGPGATGAPTIVPPPHEAETVYPSAAGPSAAEAPTIAPPAFGAVGEQRTPVGGPSDEEPATSGPGGLVRYFGDYELLNEIARGGMGVVYRARQVSLNRVVALKMILSGEFASAQDVRRFHLEAEAAANLVHPGIVPIFEIGEHDGRHFFSMAFVEGESLTDKMRAGPLPSRDAAALLRQVAEAIDHAHRQGVIHRDLKPGNILLDRQGRPQVTDFGLAKVVGGKDELTATGQAMGTPSYMPPEQVAIRAGGLGPAADIYALGATLYALITGRPPFQASSPLDTMIQVVEREPVSPRTLNPQVDRDLETICLKCLQKVPAKRYATAADVALELARYLEGRPIVARPVGPAERAWRWCRRNPAVASSGAIAAAAILLVAIASPIVAIRQSRLRLAETLARVAADDARDRAESARVAADLARAEAENSRGALARERDRTADQLYASTVSLAYREFLANNVNRARTLLAGCAPAARGWEWSYLDALCNSEQAVLRGHIGMVLQAQFGPDGKLLITKGAQDNTALVWDVASRRVVHRFTHDRGCSISPSGRTVLTISGEVATIHDTVTGSVVSTFPAGNSRILGMALSADDRLLATAHAGTILVLDLTTQKLIAQIKASDLETGNIGVRLALGPDGKRLAAATSSGPILLWDLPRGGGPVSLIGHLSETYALRFSPDGRTLASASLDDTIKLWDVERPGKNRTLLGHRGWVYAATWSADGRRVLSSGWDRTARIWDAGTGQELLTLRGNNAYVFDVAASPDGRLCATAGADSTVRIWDVAQALNLEKTLPDDFLTQQKKDKTPAEAESFLARHLTQECTNFFGHLGPVESVAFTAAGRLATTSRDGTLRLWDASSGRQIASSPLDDSKKSPGEEGWAAYTRVVSVPGGKLLAATAGKGLEQRSGLVAAFPGGVTLRDPETLAVKRTFAGLPGITTAIAMSCDETLLAAAAGEPRYLGGMRYTASKPGEVRIWEVATGRQLQAIPTASIAVTDLAFSPDGSGLYGISEDGILRRWERDGGRERFRVEAKGLRMALDRDGKRLAIGRADGAIEIRDAADGRPIRSLEGHTAVVMGLSFSPDGTRLVSASHDASVKLWDVEKGFELLTFRNHTHEVYQAIFSPDGRRIATCGHDITAKVYDARLDQSDALAGDWPVWYREDFRQGGSMDRWLVAFGNWSVRSGRMAGTTGPFTVPGLAGTFNGAYVTLRGRAMPDSTDVRIRFSIDRPTNVQIGMTVAPSFRGEAIDLCAAENPYTGARGADILKRLSTMQFVPVVDNRALAVATNRSHDVRIIRRPERITLFLNGQEAVSSRLMTEEGASLSVGAFHGEPGASLMIESIEIRAPREALDKLTALRRIEALFREVGLRSEVIARVKADTALDDTVREIAARLAENHAEDVEAIEKLALDAVATDGRTPADYALAVRQAEAVLRSNPGRSQYLTLLGEALYRAGRYDDAHQRLVAGRDAAYASTGQILPANLAFAAMALKRMGRPEDARREYGRFRDAMRSSDYSGNELALRYGAEADHVLGHPALDPRAEAIKDIVIGTTIAGWEKGDLAAVLAALADDFKQTDARTGEPGPYELTVDKTRFGATRKLQFADTAGLGVRIYFDGMTATIEGDRARFACRMTATVGGWREVGEMQAGLRLKAGRWEIALERDWPIRRTREGRLADCDAAYWKARDDEVDRARKAGDPRELAAALFAAARRVEGYEVARKVSERAGAKGPDWQTRAEAALAAFQPEDALRSWAEAIRLDPALSPPQYLPLPRLDPVPRGRESGLRSGQSDARTTIRFANRTDGPVGIKWIDSNGAEKEYQHIEPGKDSIMSTFATHAFVVIDKAGKPIRYFVATRQATEAVVTRE